MDDNSAKAVERALTILEALAERDNGMTNAEISRRLSHRNWESAAKSRSLSSVSKNRSHLQ